MRSIKVKTTVFVGSIIFFMIAVLVAVNMFFSEPYFVYEKEKSIYSLYNSLKENYSDDSDVLQSLIGSYEETNSLQVEIFDEEMNLVYTTGRRMNEGFSPAPEYSGDSSEMPSDIPTQEGNFPDFFPRGGGSETDFKKFGNTQDKDKFSEDAKVETLSRIKEGSELLTLHGKISEGDEYRYVSIQTPLTAIADSVNVMNKLIVSVSALIFIFGCAAAYIFAIRFSRPIQNIEKVAQGVANLDFSKKADENSSAEFFNLSASINKMSETLSAFISELMEKNELLHEDNERLAKMEEMRREFVANVSHELKSPLALLNGYAEMLKNKIEGLDVDQCYDIIIEQSEKMNGMIKSMLDVASIEHGLKQLNYQKLDMSELVKTVVEKDAVLFSNRNISMDYEIEDGCHILADSFYMEQAIKNYINNAVSHVKTNGKIMVKLFRENKDIVFSVYNDGENIPENKINKIWDSFYKTNEARTRDEGNNIGLGLYIVKTIISSHSGIFGVVNHENGVEFFFRLSEFSENQND